MSTFHENELNKILNATRGGSRLEARMRVASLLSTKRDRVHAAMATQGDERLKQLRLLVNEATALRHAALAAGATSESDPEWAAAAVFESWVQSLFAAESGGMSKRELLGVESLISRLDDDSDRPSTIHQYSVEPGKDFFDRPGAQSGERKQSAGCALAAILIGAGLSFVFPPVGVPILLLGVLAMIGSIPSKG